MKSYDINYPYTLATIHRQENTDDKNKLISIFTSLDKINSKSRVIMPLHPRTAVRLKDFNIKTKIKILPPLGYFNMLSLLNNADIVITDSGGLQKEAFFAKKKCITVREQTEWIELIESGVNILSSQSSIDEAYSKMELKICDFSKSFYGRGNASQLIIDTILKI